MFKLNEYISNKECIGKMVTAYIGEDRSWINYSKGNNGEENYYRDYHDKETG